MLAVARARKLLWSAFLLPWVALRYDVFVLEGRDLFFNGRGLWLLRLLRKRIVVVFLGSDHRPPYLSGIWLNEATEAGYRRMRRDSQATAARVRRAERHAQAIIALPTSAQFHTIPFVHLLAIGLPTPAEQDPTPTPKGAVVRVLHCPTNLATKGSREIEAAVERLNARGLSIDLRQLHGVPHGVVLDAIRQSDFVVDEVYSDTPMNMFAAEAASFGRAAVVGTYAHDEFNATAESIELPPTRLCPPDAIEQAIEDLASNADQRAKVGTAAWQFVTDHWSLQAVAGKMMRVVEGSVESSWMVHPRQVTYLSGWGTSATALRAGIAQYVGHYGSDALCLSGRPELLRGVLDMAAHPEAASPDGQDRS